MAELLLRFDASEWEQQRAAEERALLAIVMDHSKDAAHARAAAEAATELLRWYARFESMSDPDVQKVIERGMRAVTLKVAQAGSSKESRCWVQPLDYFNVDRKAKGDGSRPTGINSARLERRRAYGDYMTAEEARKVLTGDESKTIPIGKRAKTVGEVQDWLVLYLGRDYRNVPKDELIAFVRESFPKIPWRKPDERVTLPKGW